MIRFQRRLATTLQAVALASAALAAQEGDLPPRAPDPGVPWTKVHAAEGISVWQRPAADASVEEYRAIGVFELPAGALAAVLRDHDRYAEFFPYLIEDRPVPSPAGLYRYQRVRAPFVAERDYTLHFVEEEIPGGGLRIYFHEANGMGPPPSAACIRVPLVRGMWEVVSLDERRSRVTYHLLTDPGGTLPDLFLRFVTRKGVWSAIAALRDRTRMLSAAGRP